MGRKGRGGRGSRNRKACRWSQWGAASCKTLLNVGVGTFLEENGRNDDEGDREYKTDNEAKYVGACSFLVWLGFAYFKWVTICIVRG